MKRVILLAYMLLLIEFCMPRLKVKDLPQPERTALPSALPVLQTAEEKQPAAPESIRLIVGGQAVDTDMQDYLKCVLAAEMPASFPDEALKAQAVAARSYALYCMDSGKHSSGAVCTDHSCCQAWQSEQQQREKWGGDYDFYAKKIAAAVEATAGEYLSYEGQAIFAAFHSSSAGTTENSSQLWSELPYLVSVSSPERAEDVPNYVSVSECSPIDFRDTVLHLRPEADFTASPDKWINEIIRSGSGRVDYAVLGGVEIEGEDIRSLFSLRSTAFELEFTGEVFRFTVTGYGHGVGMSQYGAKVMAEDGSDYRRILAHYYPGAYLS